MAVTPKLGFTLLSENQERAEITVNEALLLIDTLLQGVVVSSRRTDAPTSASEGQAWAIPPSATGAWSGRSGQLAVWQGGGWVFLVPNEGWTFWDDAFNQYVRFDGAAWRRTVRVNTCNSAGSEPRPSSPLVGEMVFDTAGGVNRAIWWNGSNWVDGTNTTV